MSKYVRTEDGILTAEKFILSSLEKEFKRLGKVVRNFEKSERLTGKYSTHNFYEFDVFVPIAPGSSFLEKAEHCIMPEYDALKDVDETPNRKADNIEELCDEFVVADRDNHRGRYIVRDDGVLKEVYEKIGDVFGAVWTNKGLIYVAKMNEKGEFELL